MAESEHLREIPKVPSVKEMTQMAPPFKVPKQNFAVVAFHGHKQAKNKHGPVRMDFGNFETYEEAEAHVKRLNAAGWEAFDLFITQLYVWGPAMPPRDVVDVKYFQPHLDKIMTKENAARHADIAAFERRMDQSFKPNPEVVKMEEEARSRSSSSSSSTDNVAAKRAKQEMSARGLQHGFSFGKPQTERPKTGKIIGDVAMT